MMGEADVTAAQKTNLYSIASRVPGSRVLDGGPGSEEQALAIPKGRDAIGLEYVRRFIQDVKNRGLFSGQSNAQAFAEFSFLPERPFDDRAARTFRLGGR